MDSLKTSTDPIYTLIVNGANPRFGCKIDSDEAKKIAEVVRSNFENEYPSLENEQRLKKLHATRVDIKIFLLSRISKRRGNNALEVIKIIEDIYREKIREERKNLSNIQPAFSPIYLPADHNLHSMPKTATTTTTPVAPGTLTPAVKPSLTTIFLVYPVTNDFVRRAFSGLSPEDIKEMHEKIKIQIWTHAVAGHLPTIQTKEDQKWELGNTPVAYIEMWVPTSKLDYKNSSENPKLSTDIKLDDIEIENIQVMDPGQATI